MFVCVYRKKMGESCVQLVGGKRILQNHRFGGAKHGKDLRIGDMLSEELPEGRAESGEDKRQCVGDSTVKVKQDVAHAVHLSRHVERNPSP